MTIRGARRIKLILDCLGDAEPRASRKQLIDATAAQISRGVSVTQKISSAEVEAALDQITEHEKKYQQYINRVNL